jgi:hypothetical protein
VDDTVKLFAGKALPPLDRRSTRIALLAWTYEDAATGSGDGGRGDKPTSRLLGRNIALWPYGSYEELERCLPALNGTRRAFKRAYMLGELPLSHPDVKDAMRLLAGDDRGMVGLMGWNVFVPVAVAVAAGYLEAEARGFTRKPRRQE